MVSSNPSNPFKKKKKVIKSQNFSWAPVTHTCNPSHSGGSDQENQDSKSAWEKFARPFLEKIHHKKRAGGVAQGVGPEFKPQYHKKKKKQPTSTHSNISCSSMCSQTGISHLF
jgi:hypothetical protein